MEFMLKSDLICVVDDDESVRDGTCNLLLSAGYRVETFSSAQGLLNSPLLREASCVIMDIDMPGMSGYELQRRLSESFPGLPVVYFTARSRINPKRAVEAGAMDVLGKTSEPR